MNAKLALTASTLSVLAGLLGNSGNFVHASDVNPFNTSVSLLGTGTSAVAGDSFNCNESLSGCPGNCSGTCTSCRPTRVQSTYGGSLSRRAYGGSNAGQMVLVPVKKQPQKVYVVKQQQQPVVRLVTTDSYDDSNLVQVVKAKPKQQQYVQLVKPASKKPAQQFIVINNDSSTCTGDDCNSNFVLANDDGCEGDDCGTGGQQFMLADDCEGDECGGMEDGMEDGIEIINDPFVQRRQNVVLVEQKPKAKKVFVVQQKPKQQFMFVSPSQNTGYGYGSTNMQFGSDY